MPQTLTQVLCKNCDTPIQSNYCPDCGQARKTERITFRNILSDFFEQVTELDTGFLRTLKGLTLRPGHMIREYILGKRKPYMRPFQFYLIMLAVYFAFNELMDIDVMEAGNQFSRNIAPAQANARQQEVQNAASQLAGKYMKLMLSFLMVTQAFSLRWLYRKSGLYLAEMLVVAMFLTGYHYIFSLIPSVSSLVFGYSKPYWIITILASLLMFAYSTWAVTQFFNQRGTKAIFKAIFSVMLSMVIYIVFSMLVGICISLYYYRIKGV
jgi:hypothetical protein